MQTYLLHSGIIMAFLSIFYWLLLRQETFFKANRWLLLGNIIIALVIPILPTPTPIFQLKTDLIESFKLVEKVEKPISSLEENVSNKNNKSSDESTIPIETVPVYESTDTTPIKHPSITWAVTLKWGYIIGFSIMLFRFLIQLFSVRLQINQSEITKGIGYYLAVNNKNIAPFSFWKYIIINPNKYDETSFLQILEHERIHIIQRHTIDLVLAELFLIVQWFNPLAWWHRYLIGQNLEFLVDQTLLDNGENKQAYQYHLVQVAVPNNPLSISSNYNASQLKNRIKMMNLQRSSLASSWKYALLLPIALLMLLAFTNEVPRLPIENGISNEINDKVTPPESSYVIITPDATKVDLQTLQEKLYAFNYVLSFEKLVYENGKIVEIDAFLDYNDKMGLKIPLKWDKDDSTNKMAVITNEPQSRFGIHLSEIMINDLANRIPKEQIFIAGDYPLEQVLTQMREQLADQQLNQNNTFQKNIKDPNWKGKLTKSGRIYSGEEINKTEIDIIKAKIQKKGFPTNYILDGLESNKAVLNIPILEIEKIEFHEMRYRKFDKNGKFTHATPWNFEVKVKRRGKIPFIPKEKDFKGIDEVYIILTEEANLEEIKEVQEELLELGMKLSIIDISYNESKTKIKKISVLFEAGKNTCTVSWNKSEETYKFLIVGRNRKTTSTSCGQGDNLLKELNTNNENSKLFIIGKENNQQTIDFLEKQGAINKQVYINAQKELAKDSNWKGNERSSSSEYVNITPQIIKALKRKIKEAKSKKIQYTVDGVEWGAEALDIPVEKIEQIFWFERYFTKNDEQGNLLSKTKEELSISVQRKAKSETPKKRKGFQYFEECDCYIPKTFMPNGNTIFKIEGTEISNTSSFQLYNKWGIEVIDATPFKNDWKGEDDYGEILKPATYYFTFQTEEGKEVAQGYVKILSTEQTDLIEDTFIHQPNATHYVISPCSAEDLSQTKDFIKISMFMYGVASNKGISSINLGSDKNRPLLIVRKFDNFEQAKNTINNLNNLKSKPAILKLLPISQSNYRIMLQQKSLAAYEKFYQKEILK